MEVEEENSWEPPRLSFAMAWFDRVEAESDREGGAIIEGARRQELPLATRQSCDCSEKGVFTIEGVWPPFPYSWHHQIQHLLWVFCHL